VTQTKQPPAIPGRFNQLVKACRREADEEDVHQNAVGIEDIEPWPDPVNKGLEEFVSGGGGLRYRRN